MFGRNAAYLSVLHNKLPALYSEIKSEMLSDKPNVIHSAERVFVEAKSNKYSVEQ